jgi:Trk K+ transport system NAD-binding subunit
MTKAGYGFFIPIFFIVVGARFDLGAMMAQRSALLLVPVLIAAAYLVKIVPALIYRTLFPLRESLAAGALLASRLSLIIAASAIALEMELISSATNSAIILVAIVTCTFSPLLFERLLPPAPETRRQGVVILGTDQLAVLLGQRLRDSGEEVTFIGRDQSMLGQIERSGFRCIQGQPDDAEILAQAGLDRARGLIAISNDPQVQVAVCQMARERFGVPVVIARSDDARTVAELQAMQARVVQPALATALALEAALHFPAAFGMLLDKRDGVDFIDVPLSNPALHGRALRHVRLSGNALVLGINRHGEVIVPHGETVLRQGDILMLVGNPDSLHEAQQFLEPA